MKIEYAESPANGSLIRLFDFSNDEVLELKDMLDKLVQGEIKSLPLHEHCHVNPDDNSHLTFVLGNTDQGITRKDSEFICTLTPAGLSKMIEPVESFALHPVEFKGYEWLDESSNISLVISPSRI